MPIIKTNKFIKQEIQPIYKYMKRYSNPLIIKNANQNKVQFNHLLNFTWHKIIIPNNKDQVKSTFHMSKAFSKTVAIMPQSSSHL